MEVNRWLGLVTFDFERCAAGVVKCGIRQEWLVDAKTGKGNGIGVEDGEWVRVVERIEECYGQEGKERWLSGLRIVLVLGLGRKCLYE